MQAIDELDLANFRHGGANITGFRLLDPAFPRTTEAHRDWTYSGGPSRTNKRRKFGVYKSLPLLYHLIKEPLIA